MAEFVRLNRQTRIVKKVLIGWIPAFMSIWFTKLDSPCIFRPADKFVGDKSNEYQDVTDVIIFVCIFFNLELRLTLQIDCCITFRIDNDFIGRELKMAGINKVILIGNLGSDPEVRYTPSGDAVANFSIATSEEWKDRDSGEKKERTEWHRIVAWRRLGEICGEYLSKGRQVYVEGRLQTRSWDDQSGNKRYTTEVIASTVQFLGGRDSAGTGRSESPPIPEYPGTPVNGPSDDDIPF